MLVDHLTFSPDVGGGGAPRVQAMGHHGNVGDDKVACRSLGSLQGSEENLKAKLIVLVKLWQKKIIYNNLVK